jgi:hypothetical protein
VAITKDNFIKAMEKCQGWEICASGTSGIDLRLEIPIKQSERANHAKIIAAAHGGKIRTKKTEINFGTFTVEVKQKKAKVATKQGATEFGLLREYQTKKLVTTTYTLHTPSSKEPDEALFMNYVNTFIKKINRPIDIELNGKKFKNICGTNKVYGTPKADLVLVQLDKRKKAFKEVAFISHKKGGGAKAFQQYGGVSDRAGGGISDNALVKSFLADLAVFVQAKTGSYSGASNVSAFRRFPKTGASKALLGQSIFGPKWTQGSTTFGTDNVHCVFQGNAILTKKGSGPRSYYVLSGEAIHPPKTDWALKADTDPFRAVFAATFRNGRMVEARVNERAVTVTNMRAGIYPYDFVSSRRHVVEI